MTAARAIAGRAKRWASSRLPSPFLLDTVPIPMMRLGSSYGGWACAPHLLGPVSVVYSAGIGDDITFDEALIAETGCAVEGLDPTPTSLSWLEQRGSVDRFRAHAVGLAGHDGFLELFAPADSIHSSHLAIATGFTSNQTISVNVLTVRSFMSGLGHSRIDLLKMDIEGSEYGVVDDMVANGPFPSQLLIEFHHRFPEIGRAKTERAIDQLRNIGYKLAAVSKTREEFTFFHQDLIMSSQVES